MRYFCVKTTEYLQAVLDIVSRKATHYFVLDVSVDRAELIVDKLAERYFVDLTARQRTDVLNKHKLPVFDVVILHNMQMHKDSVVRLCVLATLPILDSTGEIENVSEYLYKSLNVNDRSLFEKFENVNDRKNRLCFKSSTEAKQMIYELIQLPYTKKEMQEKKITKTVAWTWRLHRDFIKMKEAGIEDMFKNAQKNKGKLNTKPLEILWSMSGFRGVRDDIFKINKRLFALSFKYLNRSLEIEPKVPLYPRKIARLTHDFEEMINFHSKNGASA